MHEDARNTIDVDPETGEVIDPSPTGNALPVPTPAAGGDAGLIALGRTPVESIQFAQEVAGLLTRVLRSQRMTTSMGGGREHVNVEGWTTLAAMTGYAAVIEWSRPCTDPQGEVGWEARALLYDGAGRIVGAGEGMCTRSEKDWGWHPTKRNGDPLSARDDFALRGMAQTRATSRAIRSKLGFIVAMAGFDTTPADEMRGDEHTRGAAAQHSPTALPDDLTGVTMDVQPQPDGSAHVKLRGDGAGFDAVKDAVKAIRGRRWNGELKVWEVPADGIPALRVIWARVHPSPTPQAASPAPGAPADATPPPASQDAAGATDAPCILDSAPGDPSDTRLDELSAILNMAQATLLAWLGQHGLDRTSRLDDDATWRAVEAAANAAARANG